MYNEFVVEIRELLKFVKKGAFPWKSIWSAGFGISKIKSSGFGYKKCILVCRLQPHILVVCRLWTLKIKEKRWSAGFGTPPGIPPLKMVSRVYITWHRFFGCWRPFLYQKLKTIKRNDWILTWNKWLNFNCPVYAYHMN